MKKIIIFLFLISCYLFSSSQNVGIGTNAPVASAALEVKDTTRGFLPPRMTYAQRNAIVNPAQGLIIYCTNCGIKGEVQVYNGSEWTNLVGGATSLPITIPTITTISVSGVTNFSAISGGHITSDGNSPIISKGVCWSTTPNPRISLDSKTIDGSGNGSFTSNLSGLATNTTYFLCAYATNEIGTSYGNQQTFTTNPISIGQNYAGGIVFYVDNTGQHGLVCAPSDQSYFQWGCYNSSIPSGTNTAFGSGETNTNNIVSGCGDPNIAAKICFDLNLNGYDDWYLPSRDELALIYSNLRRNLGINFNGFYWSSSESNAMWAWSVNLNTGAVYDNDFKKYTLYYVRAVRNF